MQLMTGIGPLFLNQDPAKFHWIDRGWMTSLWEFLNTANLTTSWTPKLQQEHDIFLMEYCLSWNCLISKLHIWNHCRLYLQVTTLSDIATANGIYILPEAKLGRFLLDRTSSLNWPEQQQPSRSDWNLWNQELSYRETRGKLTKALGQWVTPAHQTWRSFLNQTTNRLYIHKQGRYLELTPVHAKDDTTPGKPQDYGMTHPPEGTSMSYQQPTYFQLLWKPIMDTMKG